VDNEIGWLPRNMDHPDEGQPFDLKMTRRREKGNRQDDKNQHVGNGTARRGEEKKETRK
jgi:hypothetical protein